MIMKDNLLSKFIKYCEECYSAISRVTPLLNPEKCLKNHTQYICGTCGRCICIEKDSKRGLRRWNFPFKTLEIAKLYLRVAEYCCQSNCGIYELGNNKDCKSYKIFASQSNLLSYISKNKKISCSKMQPVFQNSEFKVYKNTLIKRLNEQEVSKYLNEMKNMTYNPI